jgi:hypothetical protein
MSSRLCITLATVVLTVFSSTNPRTVGGEQGLLTPEQTQIVNTVSTVFTAARADDLAKFDAVIAPDFYIFDGGARFDGDAIMALIKAQHAAGKRYEWNVTEPDVHISGNTGWIAYVNKGSISDASGTMEQEWLESAFLEKREGVWKIVFMHSTRVPPRLNQAR